MMPSRSLQQNDQMSSSDLFVSKSKTLSTLFRRKTRGVAGWSDVVLGLLSAMFDSSNTSEVGIPVPIGHDHDSSGNAQNAIAGTLLSDYESSPSFTWESVVVDPLSISGLVTWLKYDEGIENISDTVNSWLDKSANAYSYVAPSSGARPAYTGANIDGRTVPDFDGSNDQLVRTGCNLAQNVGGFSVFMLVSLDTTSDCRLFTVSTGSQTTVARAEIGVLSGAWLYAGRRQDHPAETTTSFGSGGTVTTGKHLVEAYFNYATARVEMIVDGVVVVPDSTVFSTAGNTTNSSGNARLATASSQVLFLNGKIGEVMAYNKTLSQSERNAIRHYFQTNWP